MKSLTIPQAVSGGRRAMQRAGGLNVPSADVMSMKGLMHIRIRANMSICSTARCVAATGDWTPKEIFTKRGNLSFS